MKYIKNHNFIYKFNTMPATSFPQFFIYKNMIILIVIIKYNSHDLSIQNDNKSI